MVRLPHTSPDCTGGWGPEPHGTLMYWRCNGCGGLAYPSLESREAAHQENTSGVLLGELARAGRKLLDSNGPAR